MRKRILVVEDDPDLAAFLAMLFQPARYAVRVAGSLARARALLAEPPAPDLVLLDVVLPDGNGLELCRELKAARPALPVLLLTARDEAEIRRESRALGPDLFMMKPFEPEEVQAAARWLLLGRGARRRTA